MISEEWITKKIDETEQIVSRCEGNIIAEMPLKIRLVTLKEVLAEYRGESFDPRDEMIKQIIGNERFEGLKRL